MTMEALRAVAPFAGAIALSPVTIALVIALLLRRGAQTRARAFLAVWLAALATLVIAALWLLPTATDTSDTRAALSSPALDLAVGGLLVVLALVAAGRALRRRHRRPLMDRLDRLTPLQTAGVAAIFALNPKNVALALGGVAAVPTPGPSTAGVLAVGAVFAAVASAPLLAAVGISAASLPGAQRLLERTRGWMDHYADILTAVVLASLAMMMLARGLTP